VSGSQIPWAWKLKLGDLTHRTGILVTVETFLQVLGLIYFIAFTSFGLQAPGLIGTHGILPFPEFLNALREATGRGAYREAPGLLWLLPTDGALAFCWIAGAVCGAAAIFTPWRRAALAGCLILWLSLCSVGQDFLSFQWDILLSEAGFLAIFADRSPLRIWLFRWLAFRLFFFSGVVKLMSGDPTWRDLTAMHFHYETQPLPNPLAWFVYQQPMWAAKFQTAFTFMAELVIPFLFFGPRRARYAGALITAALQVVILATGNFTFFNFLAIAICFWLVVEPERRPRGTTHRAVSAALAVFIGVVSGLLCLGQFGIAMPPGGGAVLHAVDPLRIVNSYGLFAVMTTDRPEIIVEGSNDGTNWLAYEFPYKPGNVHRAPPVIEPAQPRLDWQMWFAALGSYQSNRWFVTFMLRLLQGEPAVLRLLQYNPFPQHPPKLVRARVYLYHFTGWGSHDWWWREEKGAYFPAVSLK
jgi:lipase maturation factor 1